MLRPIARIAVGLDFADFQRPTVREKGVYSNLAERQPARLVGLGKHIENDAISDSLVRDLRKIRECLAYQRFNVMHETNVR